MKPTTDEVLALAREAGLIENGDEQAFADYVFVLMLDVDNFTKIVALAYAAGAAAMKERAAKRCDEIHDEYEGEDVQAIWCAEAIRALGDDDD